MKNSRPTMVLIKEGGVTVTSYYEGVGQITSSLFALAWAKQQIEWAQKELREKRGTEEDRMVNDDAVSK